MVQTVFITGTSSGIGLASARLFYEKGWNVVATMRSPDKDTELKALHPARMLVLRLDLQELSSIAPAIDAAISQFERIDLLLNNAGYGQVGLFETISREEIQQQFDVNLFGPMELTRAILPHFRENNSGGIINISSAFGTYGFPMVSIYTASKFALEGYTEALAFELASQNIFVKNVIPYGGVTSTSLTPRPVAQAVATPESYKPYVEKTTKALMSNFSMISISADRVAEAVFEAATDGTDRLRYPVVGNDAKEFLKAKYEKSNDEFVAYMRSFFQ